MVFFVCLLLIKQTMKVRLCFVTLHERQSGFSNNSRDEAILNGSVPIPLNLLCRKP